MSQVTDRLKSRFTDFWWGDRGLSLFLLLLFIALFIEPFVESYLVQGLSAIFLSLLLISGVAYLSPRPLLRRVASAVAFLAIVLRWLKEYLPNQGLAIAASLLALVCLVSLTLVVLIRVFGDTEEVTAARVRGAVAAYLLLGITWSVLYRLIDLCLPGAFSISAATGMTPQEHREGFAYFSFVTLTTLGYGDITAIHPIARMFVVFEALLGQLYPATLLARLVSLELSNRQAAVPSPGGPQGVPTQPEPSSRIAPGGEP